MRKEDFNKAFLFTNLEYWKKEHDFGTCHIISKFIEDYQQENCKGTYFHKLESGTKVPAFFKKVFPETYFQQERTIYNFLENDGFLYSEVTHPVLKRFLVKNTLIVLEGSDQEENVRINFKKGV
jgi:hypothetical protein